MRALAGILGVILLLAFLATSLSAMQLMVLVEEQSAEGDSIGSHRILVDKKLGLYMEFQAEGQHGGAVYNISEKIAYMIDFIEGTYWAMTEADAAKVKKMRQEVMPQMKEQQEKLKALFEEQMKDLSEKEKNEAMKHLPGGMGMGPGAEEEVVWEKAGSKNIDPWGNTDVYIGRQYGEMVEKVFTVGWDQLGVDESYLKVFGEFGEFAGGGFGGEGDDPISGFAQAEKEQGYPGFSVIAEHYDDFGDLKYREVTEKVEEQETDPENFVLPITEPPLDPTDSPFDDMPTGMPAMPPGF